MPNLHGKGNGSAGKETPKPQPKGEEPRNRKKRKSKPTSKERNRRQKVKARYSKAREDAQLAGIIPTTPEGALKPEAVPSYKQDEQRLPGLIGQAIRSGWAVPEDKKPELVKELVGVVSDDEATNVEKVMAFNALTKGDQLQWERDNPELAGKTKGGVKVNNNNQVVVPDWNRLHQAPQPGENPNPIEDEIEEEIRKAGIKEVVEGSVETVEGSQEQGLTPTTE